MMNVFVKLYYNISVLFSCLWGVSKSWFLIVKYRQKPEFDILQTSHRLEKGLLNANPKPLWGWDKANRLVKLLKSVPENSFSAVTGRAVLSAYIENKRTSSDKSEQTKAEELFSKLDFPLDSRLGGGITIGKPKVLLSQEERSVCEKLFNSRHSARDFNSETVKKEDIEAAVRLALRAPSACNRQPTRVYVLQEGTSQSIFLTVDIRAFNLGEFHDWIVSPSIFAGYLSLALHLYGIGSCIFRKPLYGNPEFMRDIRTKCNIPAGEKIIIELKFGYYKETFMAAFSNRQKASDIICYS